MATKTLTTRIIIRNDVKNSWTSVNPVLLKGEIGFETDTNKYKIGNGVDAWNSIPYYTNINSTDAEKLDELITMLNNDDFGKVDDVKVNSVSVVNEKVANISIGALTISETAQSTGSNESFTGDITLHKIAKTGNYADLIGAITVVDNLDSTSTTNALSANQGNKLKQLVQNITFADSFATISDMVTALNSKTSTAYKIGVNLFVQALNVPDFWIYSVESTSVPYTYVDDATLINAVNSNGFVQIGYYKISKLETQKVDLSNYYTKTETDDLLSNKITNSSVNTFLAYASIKTSGSYKGLDLGAYNATTGEGLYMTELLFSTEDFVDNPSNKSSRFSLSDKVVKTTDTLILNGGTSEV